MKNLLTEVLKNLGEVLKVFFLETLRSLGLKRK